MAALRNAVHDLRAESEWRARYTLAGLPARAEDSGGDPFVELLVRLQDATTRYVVELRAEGTPPEQMLVRVKSLVRDALSVEGWSDPEATRSLTAAVVGWSIDTYYDR